MIVERWLKLKFNFQMKGIIGNIITFLIVMLFWLLFRAPSIDFAIKFLKNMFINSSSVGYYKYSYYIPGKTIVIALIGFVFSIYNYKNLSWLKSKIIRSFITIIMLLLSMAFMSDANFTPFIYFQF